MKEGGSELRKWVSNSVKLINNINRDENIAVTHQMNRIIREVYKVWGINWDLAADAIIFYFDELVNEAFSLPVTKYLF